MATSRLERQQRNIFIIKASIGIGTMMFLGFAYLMFNIMGL